MRSWRLKEEEEKYYQLSQRSQRYEVVVNRKSLFNCKKVILKFGKILKNKEIFDQI